MKTTKIGGISPSNQIYGKAPISNNLDSEYSRLSGRVTQAPSAYHKTIRQGQLDSFMKSNPNYKAPGSVTQTPAAPAATPAPVAQVPAQPATSNPGLFSSLFPANRSFEPTNYEGSPLYKFQSDEGLRKLAEANSARGLTDSSTERENNRKFLLELGAKEADTQRGYAQQDADRLNQIQQFESSRLSNREDSAYNNLFRLLEIMQQDNPYATGVGAAGSLASSVTDSTKWLADQQAGNYARLSGGGGGGGGNSTPATPSQGNLSAVKALTSASSNNLLTNLVNSIISKVF